MGRTIDAFEALVVKPERRRSLRKPMRRCEDNIKTDLQEKGWGALAAMIWGSGCGQVLCSYEPGNADYVP